MKTLFLLLSLLLPCVAQAGEMKELAQMTADEFADEWNKRNLVQTADAAQLRIVRCTDGTAAVQEYRGIEMDCPNGLDSCRRVEYWRTLPSAPGCYPLEAARRLRNEEIAWRNRPPAPTVKEPVEVVE